MGWDNEGNHPHSAILLSAKSPGYISYSMSLIGILVCMRYDGVQLRVAESLTCWPERFVLAWRVRTDVAKRMDAGSDG
jgi:hypothetical protein